MALEAGLEMGQEFRQGLGPELVIDLGGKPAELGCAFVVRIGKSEHSAGHSQPHGRGGSGGICCSRAPAVKPPDAAGERTPARLTLGPAISSDKRLN